MITPGRSPAGSEWARSTSTARRFAATNLRSGQLFLKTVARVQWPYGIPYVWGSIIVRNQDDRLALTIRRRFLFELFPPTAASILTSRGGVLAIHGDGPVRASRLTMRFLAARGFVGEGVATTNLAGRTMAELITDADTQRVGLPWIKALPTLGTNQCLMDQGAIRYENAAAYQSSKSEQDVSPRHPRQPAAGSLRSSCRNPRRTGRGCETAGPLASGSV